YISFRDDQALAEAKQAEDEIAAGNYRGPLHGIPMAIKDNIYIGGEVSTMASKIHGDFVSQDDASVVVNLREAGAVLTGKLNMHGASIITHHPLVQYITPGIWTRSLEAPVVVQAPPSHQMAPLQLWELTPPDRFASPRRFADW